MRRRGLHPLAAATTVVLAAWAFFPVVLLAAHASVTHAVWTGADGLIGADGVLGADQLQYLAWARSIAEHGLASDLFTLGRSAHVYLEPASGVVGGLLALGVPLVTGYLIVKAIAVVVLAAGTVAWVVRLLHGRGRRLAGVALALFTVTPAASIVNWAQIGSGPFRFGVYLGGDEILTADKLWGYVPSALAVALLAIALLALERALTPGASRTGPLATAALCGLLCSWLHPWQGITLAILVLALAAVRRRPAELPALGLVLVAVALPLVYYGVLSHADPAWRLAAHNESGPRLTADVLALCVAPLVLVAALGVRRPGDALAEQALLLWIPAALVTYFANDAFATHALQGIPLPFAVLAVRGADRLRVTPLLGWVCVGLLTVPGLAYDARKFVRVARSPLVQYALPAPDAAALRWVADRAPPGGVLAPLPFAAAIPEQTGRAVWVGHGDWSPDYRARARAVDALFAGRLSTSAARTLVAGSGARLLVADCAHPAGRLRAELGTAVVGDRSFGCARVLVVRGSVSSPAARPRR